mmetsp:Transcript_33820/g.132880  ORF Transcript_33820/g.132880 Transcript_33820/m.132880 type:complete len:797 (-) Transcript_33820:1251-3641(-)
MLVLGEGRVVKERGAIVWAAVACDDRVISAMEQSVRISFVEGLGFKFQGGISEKDGPVRRVWSRRNRRSFLQMAEQPPDDQPRQEHSSNRDGPHLLKKLQVKIRVKPKPTVEEDKELLAQRNLLVMIRTELERIQKRGKELKTNFVTVKKRLKQKRKRQDGGRFWGNGVPVAEEVLNKAVVGRELGTLEGDFPLGIFLQFGANPRHKIVLDYHHFNGEGMVSAVFLRKGGNGKRKIAFSRRFIQTGSSEVAERLGRHVICNAAAEGRAGFFSIMRNLLLENLHGARKFRYNSAGLLGGANTAGVLAQIRVGNRLVPMVLALDDVDQAYMLAISREECEKPEDCLATVGYNPFKRNHPMGAHSRKGYTSEGNGVIVSVGMRMDPWRPVLNMHSTPFVFIHDGEVYRTVEVPMKDSSFSHDFGMSTHYCLMLEGQAVMDWRQMFADPIQGKPLYTKRSKRALFHVLPLTDPQSPDVSDGANILFGDDKAVNRIQEVHFRPGEECFILHFSSICRESEDGKHLTVYATAVDELDMDQFNQAASDAEDDKKRSEAEEIQYWDRKRRFLPQLYEFKLDLDRRAVVSKTKAFGEPGGDGLIPNIADVVGIPAEELVVEFPTGDRRFPSGRYIWLCYTRMPKGSRDRITSENPDIGHTLGGFQGIIKLDTFSMKASALKYPRLMNGGEPAFIARPGAEEQDDGWLACFVTTLDPNTGELKSHIAVMDAKDMGDRKNEVSGLPDGFIWMRELGFRVPWGLHVLFVDEAELAVRDVDARREEAHGMLGRVRNAWNGAWRTLRGRL